MSAKTSGFKRGAWLGVIALLASGAGWWTWTRSKPPVQQLAAKVAPSFVQLAGAGAQREDAVLRERADLFDPTPLFFPTEWNYGQRPLRLALKKREPAQVFASIDAQFNFPEQGAKFYGSEPEPVTVQLPEVLGQGNEVPFAGLGRIDVPSTQLPARAAFIEIKPLGGTEAVLVQAIAQIKLPRTDFAPVEFLMLVDAAGVVGEPVLTSGSGVEEVDVYLRGYLTSVFRVGARLAPGRYRVVVGA